MAAILGCPDAHLYECPLRWEHLASTDRAPVRVCEECQSRVYACETAEQVYRHARAGRCVVFTGRPPVVAASEERRPQERAVGGEPLFPVATPTFSPVTFDDGFPGPPPRSDGAEGLAGVQGDGHDRASALGEPAPAPCPRCGGRPCTCRDMFW